MVQCCAGIQAVSIQSIHSIEKIPHISKSASDFAILLPMKIIILRVGLTDAIIVDFGHGMEIICHSWLRLRLELDVDASRKAIHGAVPQSDVRERRIPAQ